LRRAVDAETVERVRQIGRRDSEELTDDARIGGCHGAISRVDYLFFNARECYPAPAIKTI
jgi:hypothetical protein